MAKYLVTGGGGFIGSNLVAHLLDQGEEVVVVDNFSTGKRKNLVEFEERIKLITGDIRDRDTMDEAADGCTAIFHQAALGSVPRSVKDPLTSHDVNVNGTINVLEAAKSGGVKRVIFAGSSSVYGNTKESPKHELMPQRPASPYAGTKVAAEGYIRAWAQSYGLETITLRYFNVFGPKQSPGGPYAAVIPAFVSSLLDGRPPIVYGDGKQSRDFCFIENVCLANLLAARAPSESCDGRAMNIACNRSTDLLEILRILNEELGTDIEPEFQPPRAGDVKHSLADISLAVESIGYTPAVYFEEGLRKAVNWYRNNL